jgi:hypothetical protein
MCLWLRILIQMIQAVISFHFFLFFVIDELASADNSSDSSIVAVDGSTAAAALSLGNRPSFNEGK